MISLLVSRGAEPSEKIGTIVSRQTPQYKLKVALLRGDVEWSLQRTLVTQGMAVLVGTIAGLLGLGGGELMAPLLDGLALPRLFQVKLGQPDDAAPRTFWQAVERLAGHRVQVGRPGQGGPEEVQPMACTTAEAAATVVGVPEEETLAFLATEQGVAEIRAAQRWHFGGEGRERARAFGGMPQLVARARW